MGFIPSPPPGTIDSGRRTRKGGATWSDQLRWTLLIRFDPAWASTTHASGTGRFSGMTEMMTTDVRAIMDRTPFDVSAVADLREVLNRDPSRYRTLRDAVATIRDREAENKDATPETHLRLGVGEILLGRYNAGLDSLKLPATPAWPTTSRAWRWKTCSATPRPPRRSRSRARPATTPGTPSCTRRGVAADRQDRRRQEDPPRPGDAWRLVGRVPLPAGRHARLRRRT